MATRLYGPDFGEQGSKDKYGIISHSVPYYCESLADAAYGTLPNDTGFGENRAKRTWQPWAGGTGYIVVAVFEGADPSLIDSESFYWEFDSSFAERRLESHPRIKDLITKYGGQVQDDGQIFWPLTYSEKVSGSGLSGSAASSSNKNPLFGADSYVELQAVFRAVRIRSSPSSDLLDRIGTIKKDLPVSVTTPANRDWLIMPPRVAERGNVVTETEEWLIGPPGGWPQDIYELLVV